MKNQFNVKTILGMVGIIALVAVIGFSFSACDNGTTGGDDDGVDLKSKMVTITIQNNTNKEDEDHDGRTPVKITGVKVYFNPEDKGVNPESYLIGDANTFDTTLIADAGASVTIPAVNVSQYEAFGGEAEFPLIRIVLSREGSTREISSGVKPDSSTSDETLNLELWRGHGSRTSGQAILSKIE